MQQNMKENVVECIFAARNAFRVFRSAGPRGCRPADPRLVLHEVEEGRLLRRGGENLGSFQSGVDYSRARLLEGERGVFFQATNQPTNQPLLFLHLLLVKSYREMDALLISELK